MIASKRMLAAAPSARAGACRPVPVAVALGSPALRRCQCAAAQQQQHQQEQAQAQLSQAAAAPLALTILNLAAAAPSWADDIIALGDGDKPLFALSPAELALVSTPLVGYAIYNYARMKNANLGFQDLLLIIAAVFLFGNIFSILVFKTSFY